MKHLDIGCGITPKNPYNFDEIYGVDLFPEVSKLGPNFKQANIAVDKIPFKDNFFDSISAFDVLEHIPRQQIDYSTGKIYFPFISLMNEIYRTLKPNGLFYALTPAYPGSEAFQDPTHVNFIAYETCRYFTGKSAYAKRYGFNGEFEKVEMKWMYSTYGQTSKRSLIVSLKNWHKVNLKLGKQHLVWQLKAIK
jgi:SAM-dependent methyltransferase